MFFDDAFGIDATNGGFILCLFEVGEIFDDSVESGVEWGLLFVLQLLVELLYLFQFFVALSF